MSTLKRTNLSVSGSSMVFGSNWLTFCYVAPLALRFYLCRYAFVMSLRWRCATAYGVRKCLPGSLPSAYPSSRVAVLGNSLGYIMSRLRRCEGR
jgi:hypothetical protein